MKNEIMGISQRSRFYLTNGICTSCGGDTFVKLTKVDDCSYAHGQYKRKMYRKFCKKCKMVCNRCICL